MMIAWSKTVAASTVADAFVIDRDTCCLSSIHRCCEFPPRPKEHHATMRRGQATGTVRVNRDLPVGLGSTQYEYTGRVSAQGHLKETSLP